MTDDHGFDQILKEFERIKPVREIKINFAPFIGSLLALYAGYALWGGLGAMLASGLLLQSWTISLTFKRRL